MSATNSAISSPSRPSQSPSQQQATFQDVYDLIRGILYQQSPAKGDAFDAPSCPSPQTAPQDGHGEYPSASTPTILFFGRLEAAMMEGGEGGGLLKSPAFNTVDLVQQSWLMGDRKRLRTEEQDTSDAHRLAKKHKGPRVETQSTPPRRTSARKNRARKLVAAPSLPVAGPSNLRSAAADQDAASVYESDPDEDTDRDTKDYAPDGTGTATTRTKRARRTKDQIKAVTRTDLPKIHCPVEGCETMFDPLTHDANRDHLERHYETGALDGKASLSCLWTECEKTPIGTKMITHLHEHHVGRAFICSVKNCKWGWASSRSGDLPLHLARRHKS
ncbi:hypothetical protein VTO73DRAFT_11257 [Trametes versicolor]